MTGSTNIQIDTIITAGRMRSDYSGIEELADSIQNQGLIQPLVVNHKNELIAGGRRLTAMKMIGWVEAPCVILETLDEHHLRVLEYEENWQRKDFTWQEKCIGLETIHKLKKSEALKNHENWTFRASGNVLGVAHSTISNAVILAECIKAGDKEVIAASSAKEATDILLKREEHRINKELARKHTEITPHKKGLKVDDILKQAAKGKSGTEQLVNRDLSVSIGGDDDEDFEFEEFDGKVAPEGVDETVLPFSKMFKLGDSVELLKNWDGNFFDACITDLPYAIDMDNLTDIKDIDETRDEHDVADNMELFSALFPQVYRVLKKNAYFVTFMDLANFETMKMIAEAAGFAVQRWPLIWYKTSPCKNSSPHINTTKNYESIMVMRKGNPKLQKPMTTSVFMGPNLGARQLGHPFAKGEAVWQWLFEHFSPAFGQIIDPCCGVGSSAVAGLPKGYGIHGMELVENHFNKIPENLVKAYANIGLDLKLS